MVSIIVNREFLTYCLVMLISLVAEAQFELSRSVIANAGTQIENNTNSISFTLGELAAETFVVGDRFLSQGFQQGSLKGFVTASKYEDLAFDYLIYPNPADQVVFVEMSNVELEEVKMTIWDINGKMIDARFKDLSQPTTALFDSSKFIDGLYHIVIRDLAGHLVLNHSVIVTH